MVQLWAFPKKQEKIVAQYAFSFRKEVVAGDFWHFFFFLNKLFFNMYLNLNFSDVKAQQLLVNIEAHVQLLYMYKYMYT